MEDDRLEKWWQEMVRAVGDDDKISYGDEKLD